LQDSWNVSYSNSFDCSYLISQFMKAKQQNNVNECQRLTKIGIEFFYEIINHNLGELTQFWPVTDDLMKQTATKLGVSIYQDSFKSEFFYL
jgi:hypothetical protein